VDRPRQHELGIAAHEDEPGSGGLRRFRRRWAATEGLVWRRRRSNRRRMPLPGFRATSRDSPALEATARPHAGRRRRIAIYQYVYNQAMDSAALLRDARRRADLTQSEIARRAHTAQSAVAAYETGARTPGLRTLERLLRACDHELDLVARPRTHAERRHSRSSLRRLRGISPPARSKPRFGSSSASPTISGDPAGQGGRP
jgi:transcriptional regulator with XRE-family HTH domain